MPGRACWSEPCNMLPGQSLAAAVHYIGAQHSPVNLPLLLPHHTAARRPASKLTQQQLVQHKPHTNTCPCQPLAAAFQCSKLLTLPKHPHQPAALTASMNTTTPCQAATQNSTSAGPSVGLVAVTIEAVQHDAVLRVHAVLCFLEHYTGCALDDSVCALQAALCW